MIIARSPLRITLGGGGTDLPSYYREHEGFLVSAAIDKYVYVNVMRPFTEGIYLKYSQLEHVEKIADVKHPIIREALQMLGFKTPQVEITTLADIPAGTGNATFIKKSWLSWPVILRLIDLVNQLVNKTSTSLRLGG
jgi:D-glycero-alpha-D-manno-heptose-7-phosphate kinase